MNDLSKTGELSEKDVSNNAKFQCMKKKEIYCDRRR
jgi:hypothetical protein